jgi:hypothetical protein
MIKTNAETIESILENTTKESDDFESNIYSQMHPENNRHNNTDYVGYNQTESVKIKSKSITIEGKGKLQRLGTKDYEFDKLEIDFPTDLSIKIEGNVYEKDKKIIANNANISITGKRPEFVISTDDESNFSKGIKKIPEKIIQFTEDPNVILYSKGKKTEMPQIAGKIIIEGDKFSINYQ